MITDDEIRKGIENARKIAARVGSLHGWWDVISDARDLLDGKPTVMTRDEFEEFFRKEKLL